MARCAYSETHDTASIHMSLEGLSPDNLTGPWVSDQDKSSIRRRYTKNTVQNVTLTATLYGELLLEANRWAIWADELDKTAELIIVSYRKVKLYITPANRIIGKVVFKNKRTPNRKFCRTNGCVKRKRCSNTML